MPLIRKASKKALAHNIEAEMEAHPEPSRRAQNIAIAYAVKKKAAKKRMAQGGEVHVDMKAYHEHLNKKLAKEDHSPEKEEMPGHIPPAPPRSQRERAIEAFNRRENERVKQDQRSFTDPEKSRMAEGGEVEIKESDAHREAARRIDEEMEAREAHNQEIDEQFDDIEERAKRHRYAHGGEVDIESNAQEEPNFYDDRNVAVLKENYDEDMSDVTQPWDSNEHAVDLEDEDENGKGMISEIRSRMKSRRK